MHVVQAKHLDLLMKRVRKSVMHPGQARLLYRSVFEHAQALGGGIRWWVQWEQEAQLEDDGIEEYHERVVKTCVQKSYSEKSMKKIDAQLSDPGEMAFCLVEAAAVRVYGKVFCESTYQMESKGPMALTAHMIFSRMEDGAHSNQLSAMHHPMLAACL